MKNYSEVTIIGAGLAGTTLALQLINENANLSITLIEKRNGKDLSALIRLVNQLLNWVHFI